MYFRQRPSLFSRREPLPCDFVLPSASSKPAETNEFLPNYFRELEEEERRKTSGTMKHLKKYTSVVCSTLIRYLGLGVSSELPPMWQAEIAALSRAVAADPDFSTSTADFSMCCNAGSTGSNSREDLSSRGVNGFNSWADFCSSTDSGPRLYVPPSRYQPVWRPDIPLNSQSSAKQIPSLSRSREVYSRPKDGQISFRTKNCQTPSKDVKISLQKVKSCQATSRTSKKQPAAANTIRQHSSKANIEKISARGKVRHSSTDRKSTIQCTHVPQSSPNTYQNPASTMTDPTWSYTKANMTPIFFKPKIYPNYSKTSIKQGCGKTNPGVVPLRTVSRPRMGTLALRSRMGRGATRSFARAARLPNRLSPKKRYSRLAPLPAIEEEVECPRCHRYPHMCPIPLCMGEDCPEGLADEWCVCSYSQPAIIQL